MVKQSAKNPASENRQRKVKAKGKESVGYCHLKPCQLRKLLIRKWNNRSPDSKIRTLILPKRDRNQDHCQDLLSGLKEENLNCPICLDLCLYPVLTDCGHYYCLPCFQQAHRISDACCVCRSKTDTFDYQVNVFLKNMFEEYIKTKIDWCEAEIYWNRERDLQRRQSRRSPSEILRIGQMVDFRWNRIWVEGRLSSVKEKAVEVQFCDPVLGKELKAQVSRHSRALARHRSFTVDPQAPLQQKKIPPIISIYVRPQRRRRSPFEEQPVEQVLTERDLQQLMSERMRRNNWDEDIGRMEEQNVRTWLFEESYPVHNPETQNIWDLNLVEEDQEEDNFFQLVL